MERFLPIFHLFPWKDRFEQFSLTPINDPGTQPQWPRSRLLHLPIARPPKGLYGNISMVISEDHINIVWQKVLFQRSWLIKVWNVLEGSWGFIEVNASSISCKISLWKVFQRIISTATGVSFKKGPKKFQKSSKKVPKKVPKKFQKSSKKFKFFGQVMSPHHSDQMSQRSQVSRVALCMSKVKVLSVSQSVSQSVTRSPIELFWTAKNNEEESFLSYQLNAEFAQCLLWSIIFFWICNKECHNLLCSINHQLSMS